MNGVLASFMYSFVLYILCDLIIVNICQVMLDAGMETAIIAVQYELGL